MLVEKETKKVPLISTYANSSEGLSSALFGMVSVSLPSHYSSDFGVPGDSEADRSMAAECEKERGVPFQSPEQIHPHTFVMPALNLKLD